MITKKGTTYYDIDPVRSVTHLLERSVALYPDTPVVMYREHAEDDTITKTYAELSADVAALRQGLFTQGYGDAGIKIAVIGENSYTWMLAYLAAMTGNAMIVPLDRLLKMDEVEVLLNRAEVDVLFYDAGIQPELERVLPNLTSLRLAVPMLTKRAAKAAALRLSEALERQTIGHTMFISLDDILQKGRDSAEQLTVLPLDADEPRALLFTSGTTANSKGVLLSQGNLAADVNALARVIRFKQGFRSLSVLPLHHTFENTCGFLTVMYFGGTICIADGLRHIQKNLLEYKVDMLIGVPALFDNFYQKVQTALEKKKKTRLVAVMRPVTRLLRALGIDVRRKIFHEILDSLGGKLATGISGAAALNPEVIRFFDDIGVRIVQGYGLTETSPVAAGCNDFVFHAGSVGHPLAGVELAIDSSNPQEPGEILIRGPIVMKGYYRDEAATREAIDEDGWFHTGDLGLFDKRGMLTITGRLKSMIVLESGKKIFPEEIEALINRHEYVKDSLVYAQADEKGGIVISAKIVFDENLQKETSSPTIAERLETIVQEVNRSVPIFKNVKSYYYSYQDMVRTTTLKVKRNVEIAQLERFVSHNKLNWRQLIGQNIDDLIKAASASQSVESGNP